jgi:hypothetical protein
MSEFSKTRKIGAFAQTMNVREIKSLAGKDKGVFFAVITTADGEEIVARIAKSYKGKIDNDCMVSWFSPADGEASWLLHPEGERPDAIVTLSFSPTVKKAVVVADLDDAI